jgi:hypothetical protein
LGRGRWRDEVVEVLLELPGDGVEETTRELGGAKR